MFGGACWVELDEEDGAFPSCSVRPGMRGCLELDEEAVVLVGGPLSGAYEYPVHR